MRVKDILKETEIKMKRSIESADREFSEVRTGRAHPGLIEGMHVDYFGTATPFKQIASVSTPDPRTVLIQPWDVSIIPEIEKAISNSNLGLSPINDGKVVRISIPPLSEERREEFGIGPDITIANTIARMKKTCALPSFDREFFPNLPVFDPDIEFDPSFDFGETSSGDRETGPQTPLGPRPWPRPPRRADR